MDKVEMRKRLLSESGIGVMIKDERGRHYLFYQDYINDDARSRAIRHLKNDNTEIKFYSVKWARKSQFKEYMQLYSNMVKLANIAEKEYKAQPDSGRAAYRFNYTYDRQFNFLKFLCNTLVKWTGCSFDHAKRQIICEQVDYECF